MRILIVDDDAMAGEMTGAVLEDAGHTVVLAENAMEAVDRVNTDATLELIISDMNMPLISGIDLFRQLREQGVELPFVLLTGDASEKLLAEEPRLDACLIKDADLEQTLAHVLHAITAKYSV